MKKVRYEVDPNNRLVMIGSSRERGLPKFRRVLDGKFKVGKDNSLVYHVKSPASIGESLPNQIKLEGVWSLTKDHDLRLSLVRAGLKPAKGEIVLKGAIIGAKGDSFLFAMTSKSEQGIFSTYVIQLTGSWQADENNRISFGIKKERGRTDTVAFDGVWEINKDNEIVYRYEKAELKRRSRDTHVIILRGRWHIEDDRYIRYLLENDSEGALKFKASIASFSGNYIKYEFGAAIGRKKNPLKGAVTIFGSWKIKNGLGLLFEFEKKGNGPGRISFAAEASIADKGTVVFRIKKSIGADSEFELELSRKLLGGDGEAFIRILSSGEEKAVYAGAGFRW